MSYPIAFAKVFFLEVSMIQEEVRGDENEPRIILEENNFIFKKTRKAFFLLFTNSYFILFSFIFYVLMLAVYILILLNDLFDGPCDIKFIYVYATVFFDGLAFFIKILFAPKDYSKMEKTNYILKIYDFLFIIIFIGLLSFGFGTIIYTIAVWECREGWTLFYKIYYRILMQFCFIYSVMDLYLFYHLIIWVTNTQLSRATVKKFNSKNYFFFLSNFISLILLTMDSIYNFNIGIAGFYNLLLVLAYVYYFLTPFYLLNSEIRKRTKMTVNDLFISPFLCLFYCPVDSGLITSVTLLLITVFSAILSKFFNSN